MILDYSLVKQGLLFLWSDPEYFQANISIYQTSCRVLFIENPMHRILKDPNAYMIDYLCCVLCRLMILFLYSASWSNFNKLVRFSSLCSCPSPSLSYSNPELFTLGRLLGYFVRTGDHFTITIIESLNVNSKKRTKTIAVYHEARKQ